jgi:archaellum biogenesis ATPase FlaH
MRDKAEMDAFERSRRLFERMSEARPRGLRPNGEAEDIGEPRLMSLSEVGMEELHWLWPGRIPLSKLTIIVGDPGLGKSVLSVALASTVSTGANWPDGSPGGPPAEVIMMSAEDDLSDTIAPRLAAAGADFSRVHMLLGMSVLDAKGNRVERAVRLDRDILALKRTFILKPNVRLFTIDPLSAYLGSVDSHKMGEVRGVLAPLADLAASHDVAIVGIHHPNKAINQSAIYRAAGSLGFVAAARAIHMVVRDRDNRNRRLMLPAKNNLSLDDAGLAFEIVSKMTDVGPQAVLAWDPEPVKLTADEAMETLDDRQREERSQLKEAVDWLCELFTPPVVKMEHMEIVKRGAEFGFNQKTLQRARSAAKLYWYRQPISRRYVWSTEPDPEKAKK